MRVQLLLITFFLITSCGQENYQTGSTTESETITTITQSEDSTTNTNDGEAYFYEDVVVVENIEDDSSDQSEDQSESSEETNENSDNTTEEENENHTEVSATAYRTKAGDLVILDEDGKEIKLGTVDSTAESQFNEISFPNDSFEVTLVGHNQLSALSNLGTNRFGKVSITGSLNVLMNIDSVTLNEQITNPERSVNEEQFGHFVCGDIYIESGSDYNNIIIYDKSNDSQYNDKSYQVTFTVNSNFDMTGYQKYIEFYQEVENGDLGCVYSEDAAYNDYSKSSRKLLNIIEYDFKW